MHGSLQVVKGVIHCYFGSFPFNLRLFFKFLNCIAYLSQVGCSSHVCSLRLFKHVGCTSVGFVRRFKLDLVVPSLFLTAAPFFLAAASVLRFLLTRFPALTGLNRLDYFDSSIFGGGSATTSGLFFRRRHNLLENLVERGLCYIR